MRSGKYLLSERHVACIGLEGPRQPRFTPQRPHHASTSTFCSTRPGPQLRRLLYQTQKNRTISSFLSAALTNLTSVLASSAVSSPEHHMRAHRRLPYTPSQLYALIADVDSYHKFLPYCTASRVLAWRPVPNPHQPLTTKPPMIEQQAPPQLPTSFSSPALATLTVKWGPLTESYTSRLYCIPGSVVEAVSGKYGRPTLDRETMESWGLVVDPPTFDTAMTNNATANLNHPNASAPSLFNSLITRWELKPFDAQETTTTGMTGNMTEVKLEVRFRFANPRLWYAAGALAKDKAEEMVQAFEERARRLYG